MLKTSLAALGTVVVLAAPAHAQRPEPNAPEFIKTTKAPGVTVRYLDFLWDEAAFDAVLTAGSHRAASRSWVLARLMLEQVPLKWNGKWIPVGPVILVLNPAQGGAGPTLEARYIDMREVFVKMDVVAEPPPGETYQKVPAVFKKVAKVAPRLEVSIVEKDKGYDITIHHGNRLATLRLDE
jgi:hypothetical protein